MYDLKHNSVTFFMILTLGDFLDLLIYKKTTEGTWAIIYIVIAMSTE